MKKTAFALIIALSLCGMACRSNKSAETKIHSHGTEHVHEGDEAHEHGPGSGHEGLHSHKGEAPHDHEGGHSHEGEAAHE